MSAFNPGFSAGLSAETQHKALVELNEDPETRVSKIQLLRDRMVFRPDLPFRRTDDKFLLRFLRARKYDDERAFALLCAHIEFQKHNRNFFRGLSLPDLRHVLAEGFPGVLDSTDSNGSRILLLFPGRWDKDLFSFEDVIKALIFTLEALLGEEETQVNGVVVIVDFSGWSIQQHGRYIGIHELKSVRKIFQDCFPVRVKGIHLINQPWYVHITVNMVTRFLKAKLGQRIFLHGNNLTSLHAFIHPDLLPAEFGGNQPPYDKVSWLRTLLAKNSFQHTCDTMAAVAAQLTGHLSKSAKEAKLVPNSSGTL